MAGAGNGGGTGVFDNRNGGPGLANRPASAADSMKNPRSAYCGQLRIGVAFEDRSRGYSHGLTQIDEVGNGHRIEKGLSLGEELVALGAAEHDRELMLAELG